MRFITLGIGKDALRLNADHMARIGTTTSLDKTMTFVELVNVKDLIYVPGARGRLLLEWWDAQADILIVDITGQDLVSAETWHEAAAENTRIANPFKLLAVGGAIRMDEMVGAIERVVEHTFFRAFDIGSDGETKAAFYIFRCDCTGPIHYEGSVFQLLDDGGWKREVADLPTITEICTWLGRRGLDPTFEWSVVPLEKERKP